jgi:transposase
MAAAPWVVSDELWSRIEPLLPKVERRFRYPGRKRLPDRQALQGILFVLYTGIAWRHLPAELRARRIKPEIARRQTEHGSGLGRVRWVVERTFAWLHHYKRLLVRYDRRHEIHEAFLALACCLVCFRRLQTSVNARSAERTNVL